MNRNETVQSPFSAHQVTVDVGDAWDAHTELESMYFVLSGFGLLHVESYGYPLGPETALYIPPSLAHQVTNTGSVPLNLVRYTV